MITRAKKIKQVLAPGQAELRLLLSIWNSVYPASLEHNEQSFAQYLKELDNKFFFLLFDGDMLCGWAITFNRAGERWFALLIARQVQGQGMGRLLLRTLMNKENLLSGWVIDRDYLKRCDGSPYPSPLAFYLKNGFRSIPETRLETPAISAVKITWDRAHAGDAPL